MTTPAQKVIAWEVFEHGVLPMTLGYRYTRKMRPRLGDVCVVTAGGSRVCSADATSIQGSIANMLQACPQLSLPACPAGQRRNTGPAPCFTPTGPCTRYPVSIGVETAVMVPTVQTLLAQARAVYNTNPSNLTQNQWALLQSAGIIPTTLPWTSASQLPGSQTAAVVAATTPASTDIMLGSFDLSQLMTSIPWWGWAIGAGGALFLLSGSGKRGRR